MNRFVLGSIVINICIFTSISLPIIDRRSAIISSSSSLISSSNILKTLNDDVNLNSLNDVNSNSLVYSHSTKETTTIHPSTAVNEKLNDKDENIITIPLERCSGGTNCIRVTVSYQPISSPLDSSLIYIPKKVFKLVVDTGSPYLVISDQPGIELASFLLIDEDDTNTKTSNEITHHTVPHDTNHNEKEMTKRTTAFSTIKRQFALLLDYEMKEKELLENPTSESSSSLFQLLESKYPPTTDIYGSISGTITWKQSFIEIRSSSSNNLMSSSSLNKDRIVMGVLDKNLTQESGGPLFGLIKNTNHPENTTKVQLRPTILEQISFDSSPNGIPPNTSNRIKSFQIDSKNQLLKLSYDTQKSLIDYHDSDETIIRKYIPLIDLRPLGDFVDHYAFEINSIDLMGKIFTPSTIASGIGSKFQRRMVGVFDTGLTGCLFTDVLWNDLRRIMGNSMNDDDGIVVDSLSVNTKLSANAQEKEGTTNLVASEEKNLFQFYSSQKTNQFFSVNPIYLDWFDDEETCPYIVVLGQTFLIQGCLTIDIDGRRAHFRYSD